MNNPKRHNQKSPFWSPRLQNETPERSSTKFFRQRRRVKFRVTHDKGRDPALLPWDVWDGGTSRCLDGTRAAGPTRHADVDTYRRRGRLGTRTSIHTGSGADSAHGRRSGGVDSTHRPSVTGTFPELLDSTLVRVDNDRGHYRR